MKKVMPLMELDRECYEKVMPLMELDRGCYEKGIPCLWRWTGGVVKTSWCVSGGEQGVL